MQSLDGIMNLNSEISFHHSLSVTGVCVVQRHLSLIFKGVNITISFYDLSNKIAEIRGKKTAT